MNRDVFVYISGPITAKGGYSIEENVAAAVRVFLDCLKRGLPAFCPHLSAAFPSAHSDVPYEAWMDFDFAVMERSTHVLMLPRWASSSGAIREMEYAHLLGRPVFFSASEIQRSINAASPT